MSRHGGGSRSGGCSSSSRSGGGSRSGGTSHRVSTEAPFQGCYNRSYYDRRGRYHTYYTTNADFGKTNVAKINSIIILTFLTLHLLVFVTALVISSISFGSKVNGSHDRIYIEDNIDALTDEEEDKVMELLERVYDKSGMPVTIVTGSSIYLDYYDSIEHLSEELYYKQGLDEESMLLLFLRDDLDSDFVDWHYDFCAGDDTTNCVSDYTYDKLVKNFYKGMASQNLYDGIEYAFESTIDDMAETTVDWFFYFALIPIGIVYSILYFVFSGWLKPAIDAERYFKEHPEKLDERPMTVYAVCPACGASNSEGLEKCMYCDSLLKIQDGDKTYVR